MIRFVVGVFAALIFIPASAVVAVGGPSLVVVDLPGYVHVTSKIDGDINGATLLEVSGASADDVVIDRAREHAGQGRSWRSTDGTTVALVWVLDCGSEMAAANEATGLTIGAWQRGTPFDSGLSGTSGVSTSRDGEHHYSVFWRQGTHLAAMTVFGPDAARAASDATVLARLESDALQNAIGGGRTVLDLPEGTSSKLGPARDLTRWVVGGGAAMILAAAAMIMICSTVLRRGKPQRLPMPPPPRAAPES